MNYTLLRGIALLVVTMTVLPLRAVSNTQTLGGGVVFCNSHVYQQEVIVQPTNLHTLNVYQREAELAWSGRTGEQIYYEVSVDGKLVATSKETKALLDRLDPNTPYVIQIRTVMNGEKSAEASIQIKTKALEKKTDSPDRIPYLRTLNHAGQTTSRLKPYWNDLADGKAIIIYKYDGKMIKPDEDNTLTLERSAGGSYWENHRLDITVIEHQNRRWNISYQLNVSKD